MGVSSDSTGQKRSRDTLGRHLLCPALGCMSLFYQCLSPYHRFPHQANGRVHMPLNSVVACSLLAPAATFLYAEGPGFVHPGEEVEVKSLD